MPMLEAERAQRTTRSRLIILQRVSSDGPLRLDAAFEAEVFDGAARPKDVGRSRCVWRSNPTMPSASLGGILYHDQATFRAVEHLKHAGVPPTGLRLLARRSTGLENHREAAPAYRESPRRDLNPRDAANTEPNWPSRSWSRSTAGALEVLGDAPGPAADAVRAEALLAVGRENDAIAALDAALQASPHHATLLRLRAERHRAAGELEDAARLLEQVLARDAHDLKCRNLIAQVCEARGQSREAADHLTKMKETQKLMEDVQAKNHEATGDPWNARVRLELAELCDKLGRPEMAAMWRLAAAACPPK